MRNQRKRDFKCVKRRYEDKDFFLLTGQKVNIEKQFSHLSLEKNGTI